MAGSHWSPSCMPTRFCDENPAANADTLSAAKDKRSRRLFRRRDTSELNFPGKNKDLTDWTLSGKREAVNELALKYGPFVLRPAPFADFGPATFRRSAESVRP